MSSPDTVAMSAAHEARADPQDVDSQAETAMQVNADSDNEENSKEEIVSVDADETESIESSDNEPDSDDSDDAISDCGSDDSWEGEPPPLELNYDALKHIAEMFLPGSHGACVDITVLKRGAFNEARVLHFEDGWSCIGRFRREPERELLEQTDSALATMAYVRSHTSIPVPEIYFVNDNPNHVVGSSFVLMERMPGGRLCDVWYDLNYEDKLSVVGQIANVLGQLAELKFDKVGCLRHDGTLGPLMSTTGESRRLGEQPFTTTEEYACAYLNENDPNRSETVKAYYPAIKDELRTFLADNSDNTTLHAPYRLMHGDFESQNILVEQEGGALRISGIIDWDWSHTGLLYHLCDYPAEILDHDGMEDNFEVNKLLRKHFVSSLAKHFPRGSADREKVKQCFREKTYAMNTLRSVFMYCLWSDDLEEGLVKGYLRGLRGEGHEVEHRAYGGVWDWQPDSEPESDTE